MRYENIVEKWNQAADEYNQWDELSEDEKIEFAITLAQEDSDAGLKELLKELVYLLNNIPNKAYYYKEEKATTYKLVSRVEKLVRKLEGKS